MNDLSTIGRITYIVLAQT